MGPIDGKETADWLPEGTWKKEKTRKTRKSSKREINVPENTGYVARETPGKVGSA